MSRTLIFVHVAKTGGLSLRNAIKTPSTLVVPHTAKLSEWGERASKADIVVGHIPYGLHNHLVDGREYDYMTILRHPVERVLSKYYYTTNLAVRGSCVGDFMTGQFSNVLSNLMVKHLCGFGLLYTGRVTGADYRTAMENLATFKYIGFTRELGKLFKKIKTDYNLSGELGHTNKTRNNRVETTSEADINCILQYNQWDLKLYNEARTL